PRALLRAATQPLRHPRGRAGLPQEAANISNGPKKEAVQERAQPARPPVATESGVKASIITQLRDLVPIRPLTREDALRVAEPQVRQRFSLAHELKHVLDHRFVDVIYQDVPGRDRAHWIEQVCDYFAACLLMPRPWVKRAFASGTQRLPRLADHFGVSQAAM